MKIERLLAIIVILLNRRRITAKELAERFEVSIRTIYRDIASLNEAGIPICSSQGYEGGLAIPESYKLSRQLLTPRDLDAMISTLQGVNQGMAHKDLQRIIEMLVSLLPKDDEAQISTRHRSLVVDLTPWGPVETPNQTIQVVQRAVDDTRLLAFSYRDSSSRSTSRTVEPHTLIYKGYAWYLLAYCRLRSDFRVFRLSRISDPHLADGSFLVRDPGDIHRFFQFNFAPTQPVVLRFSPTVRTKVEDSFPGAVLSYGEDDFITARLELSDDPWIFAFILGFGADAEILSPRSWRQKVKKNLTRMKTNPVVWFEIYVQDMARAKDFYEKMLNQELALLPSEGIEMWAFPMLDNSPGAMGALVKMEGCPSGGNSTLVYFACDDCAIEAARAKEQGGQIFKEKFSIGEHGFIALVTDLDGNVIGLHSMQ